MTINSFESEYIKIFHATGRSYNMFLHLYSNYQKSAKRRKKKFSLTPLLFYQLTKGRCHYCGKKPVQVMAYRKKMGENDLPYIYNGIDRKDNTRGYIKENCVPCCWSCNKRKGKLPYEIFIIDNKKK